MTEPYRVIIVEDHTILREGLRALLSADPRFEVVAEAEDGRAAIESCGDHLPDLLLMDLSMPRMNGLEAIKELKKQYPATKIIALTVHKTEEYILATLQAGANGYVLKDATHSELMMAMEDEFGFEIPDEFVVGYGIDYAQRNRNLPYIGKVRFAEP